MTLFGITNFNILNHSEQIKAVQKHLESHENGYICTVNPEFILETNKHPDFVETINGALFSTIDGVGVEIAYKVALFQEKVLNKPFGNLLAFFYLVLLLIKTPFSKTEYKYTGVELVKDLLSLANKEGFSVYFLGGWPKTITGSMKKGDTDIASEAASWARINYPNARILGGTSQFSRNKCDDKKTITLIRKSMKTHNIESLDILFVAYNHRKQEDWIIRNMHKVNAKLSVGVGGTFDYLTDHVKSPPKAVKTANLEWLYRLFTQPWRIKRVVNALFGFLLHVSVKVLKGVKLGT